MEILKRKSKSDVPAKRAFIQELIKEGYDAVVTAYPADITATKNGETYYFEIKSTDKIKYFGAATLTEWKAARDNKGRYYFVVAKLSSDNRWIFHRYDPEAFMAFSTVPPFKIFFDVAVLDEPDTRKRGKTKSVRLTWDCLNQLIEVYDCLRNQTPAPNINAGHN